MAKTVRKRTKPDILSQKGTPFVVDAKPVGRAGEIRRDIKGIIFICVGIFLFLTNYYSHTTGLLGRIIHDVLTPIFGRGVFILPVFISILGVIMLSGYAYLHFKMRLVGLVVGFLSVITLVELYSKGKIESFTWPPAYDAGGIIGYIDSYLLQLSIGITGSYIVLWASLAIAVVLIFNLKIKEIAAFGITILRIFVVLSKKLLIKEREPQAKIVSRKVANKSNILVSYPEDESKPKKVKEKPRKEIIIPERTSEEIKKTLFKEDDLKKEPKKEKSKKDVFEFVVSEQKSIKDSNYKLPSIDLLNSFKTSGFKKKNLQEEIIRTTQLLEETLASFKIDAKVVSISQGPSVTRYEIQPGVGVKVSKIANLSDDLALTLAAVGVRIEAPIPGKSVIGIEVPNKTVEMVNMSSIAKTDTFVNSPDMLNVAIGKDIEGNPTYCNLAAMPHLLVAGATGSGKSVCVNTIIISVLLRATPDEVKFLMIDPKQVELSGYNGIPHLLAPVVTNPSKAAATLKWAVLEMNKRYEEFAAIGARNLESYNMRVEELKKENEGKDEEQQVFVPQKKPYIIIIIDELADLMMVASSEVETMIARLAQMARATGIHMIIATQRPSVDVITGLIKANVPSRISFAVSSQIDSRTILDVQGAEKLLGKGDSLYKPVGSMKPKRVQGAYISDKEINRIVNHVKKQGKVQYLEEVANVKEDDFKADKKSAEVDDGADDMYTAAKELVQATGQASTSFLQRKLRIGYNRAARIIDELEEAGIISGYEGDSKSRSVLKMD